MHGCGQFLIIILFLINSLWNFARSTNEINGTTREITFKKSPADSAEGSFHIAEAAKKNRKEISFLEYSQASPFVGNYFLKEDPWINLEDEPDHQEIGNREHRYFFKDNTGRSSYGESYS